jgi:hypothetical protein
LDPLPSATQEENVINDIQDNYIASRQILDGIWYTDVQRGNIFIVGNGHGRGRIEIKQLGVTVTILPDRMVESRKDYKKYTEKSIVSNFAMLCCFLSKKTNVDKRAISELISAVSKRCDLSFKTELQTVTNDTFSDFVFDEATQTERFAERFIEKLNIYIVSDGEPGWLNTTR